MDLCSESGDNDELWNIDYTSDCDDDGGGDDDDGNNDGNDDDLSSVDELSVGADNESEVLTDGDDIAFMYAKTFDDDDDERVADKTSQFIPSEFTESCHSLDSICSDDNNSSAALTTGKKQKDRRQKRRNKMLEVEADAAINAHRINSTYNENRNKTKRTVDMSRKNRSDPSSFVPAQRNKHTYSNESSCSSSSNAPSDSISSAIAKFNFKQYAYNKGIASCSSLSKAVISSLQESRPATKKLIDNDTGKNEHDGIVISCATGGRSEGPVVHISNRLNVFEDCKQMRHDIQSDDTERKENETATGSKHTSNEKRKRVSQSKVSKRQKQRHRAEKEDDQRTITYDISNDNACNMSPNDVSDSITIEEGDSVALAVPFRNSTTTVTLSSDDDDDDEMEKDDNTKTDQQQHTTLLDTPPPPLVTTTTTTTKGRGKRGKIYYILTRVQFNLPLNDSINEALPVSSNISRVVYRVLKYINALSIDSYETLHRLEWIEAFLLCFMDHTLITQLDEISWTDALALVIEHNWSPKLTNVLRNFMPHTIILSNLFQRNRKLKILYARKVGYDCIKRAFYEQLENDRNVPLARVRRTNVKDYRLMPMKSKEQFDYKFGAMFFTYPVVNEVLLKYKWSGKQTMVPGESIKNELKCYNTPNIFTNVKIKLNKRNASFSECPSSRIDASSISRAER